MPIDELERLRARAADLDVGDDALALYNEILELDPDDIGAANMVGRSLQELGRNDEAREHWQLVVELQPGNRVAAERLRSLKHKPKARIVPRAARVAGPRRAPAEIVEPQLAGPGREGCLRFLARSILMIEKVDARRLAVTDRPSDGRFRVSGGKGSGVTPWRGMLCVFVHAPAVTPEVAAALDAAGGQVVVPVGGFKSLPESVEYGVAFDRVVGVSDALERPHREHLIRSIASGPAQWGHLHDQALRDYIVREAAL